MNAPRYALYIMVDEPRPRADTGPYATAGVVAAPAARRVVERVAPILGLVPESDRMAEIEQSLYLALQPGRPRGPAASPTRAAPPSAARPPLTPAPAVAPRPLDAAPEAPIRRTDAARPQTLAGLQTMASLQTLASLQTPAGLRHASE
jgi:cell division protein FtsI (penicillin-binding protein 3)